MKHADITGNQLHVPGFISSSDPGAIGAGKMWIDTTDASHPIIKFRNAGDTDWDVSGSVATLPDPADGSPGDVVTVNPDADGYILHAPTGGGGGSSGNPADAPPTSPSAYDDEMTGASLDAIWTTTAAPDGTCTKVFNDALGGLVLKVPGIASGNAWIFRQAISGGEGAAGTRFSVTMKLGLSAHGTNLSLTNFEVCDGSTYGSGNYMDVNLANGGSASFHYSQWDGSSHGDKDLGVAAGTIYVHLERNAANVMKGFVSLDGIQWRELDSQTKTFDINYLFIRLYGSTNSGDYTQHRVFWVRVNDARFQQNF